MTWAAVLAVFMVGPMSVLDGEHVAQSVVERVGAREVLILKEHPGLFSLQFDRPLKSVSPEDVENRLKSGAAIIGFKRLLPCDLPGVTCDSWRRLSWVVKNEDLKRAFEERSVAPLQNEWACAWVTTR